MDDYGDSDDWAAQQYDNGAAAERARCVAVLKDLRVKKPGADLISQGWNRAVDEALKAFNANRECKCEGGGL